MARTIQGKIIPTEVISKVIVGINPAGAEEELLRIDAVDEYINSGDYKSFIRIIVNDGVEHVINTLYFDVDNDFKLEHSYIQTTEANQKLLNKLMMMIQDNIDMNSFIAEITSQYFGADLNFSSIEMKEGAN